MLTAARQLPSATGLRSSTYATLLGLLAVTGMRLSEALHLARTDVECTHGSLTIRQTKFGKTRWIPLHPSTRDVLHHYARCREQLWPRPPTLRFFLSERGTPLTVWSVQRTFVRFSHQIGLRGATDRSGPRLHDLRHRFAVRTLLHWYRTGADVEQRMPTLSASLGHAHVNDTFWSLSATPELLREVPQHLDTDREEEHSAGGDLVSPPSASVFYRAADAPTASESPHDCALPSHVLSPPAVCPAAAAPGPVECEPGGSRHPVSQCLSGASRAGAGEQCQQSSCALGRAACLFPFRGAVGTTVERLDPSGPGHPQQTHSADRHRLLDPPGDRSPPGGSQSGTLDRTAGPDVMTDRGANRAPRVGTHGLAGSGRRAGRGSPWALLRHRTQGTLHPVAAGSGGGLTALAPRTPRRSCGPGVSPCPRRRTEPGWGGVPTGPTRGNGTAALPLVAA